MSTGSAPRQEAIKAVPVRHPWRWVAAVIILAAFASFAYTIATAPNLEWNQVWYWLFRHSILLGLVGTLVLTVVAMIIGISLGVVLAVMRISPNPVMSVVSWFYFWWNLPLILPHIGIGIPFTNIGWNTDTVKLITPFLASILGLGLNEGAY